MEIVITPAVHNPAFLREWEERGLVPIPKLQEMCQRHGARATLGELMNVAELQQEMKVEVIL